MRRSIWVFALLLTSIEACRSKNKEEEEVRKVQINQNEEEEGDEEVDETQEDISADEEDFDLICDSHIAPNRTKNFPQAIIFGSKKGGTRALIEFAKIHPLIKSAGPEVHFFDREEHFQKGLDW